MGSQRVGHDLAANTMKSRTLYVFAPGLPYCEHLDHLDLYGSVVPQFLGVKLGYCEKKN